MSNSVLDMVLRNLRTEVNRIVKENEELRRKNKVLEEELIERRAAELRQVNTALTDKFIKKEEISW